MVPPAAGGRHCRVVPDLIAAASSSISTRLDVPGRDAEGMTTADRIAPVPGPWDDCFTDLRRPPVLRWPGFLELTIDSECRDWVIYTVPTEALCVEPQTARRTRSTCTRRSSSRAGR